MNEQRFLAELSRLLGFMSTWDREAELEKYKDMFADSPDPEATIESLGSPTHLAILIAQNYVPSPRPETAEGEDAIPESEPYAGAWPEAGGQAGAMGLDAAGRPYDGQRSPGPEPEAVFAPGESLPPETLRAIRETRESLAPDGLPPADEPEPAWDGLPAEPGAPRRGKVRVLGLIVSILFGLLIGLPVALLLLVLGLPFVLAGCGLIVGASYAAVRIIPALTMLADVMMVAGSGLALGGAGLLLLWLGLWLSISLGQLWIGGVVFRLGRRLSCGKGAAKT